MTSAAFNSLMIIKITASFRRLDQDCFLGEDHSLITLKTTKTVLNGSLQDETCGMISFAQKNGHISADLEDQFHQIKFLLVDNLLPPKSTSPLDCISH